jgi:hypothetical protein
MHPRAVTLRASLTLALAAAAACSGGTAGPHSTSSPPSGLSGSTPSGAAPPPSAPVPALPGGGERAFVSDDTGLVEVSTAGGSQVVAPAASWCSADARANVVWFVTAAGLHAFDLADRRTHTIIQGPVQEIAVIIDWGQQRVGGESALLFDVAAAVHMTAKPAIEMVMGCDGDRAVYCYEEDLKTPTAEVAKQQRIAGALKLADPAYVASLASRGRQGSLWTPPPMPPAMPKRKPTVDPKQCEDRSTCGALTAIPASPLWLVQTANSRGDYYHETRELWDPATGEYVHRDRAKLVRSKAPPPDTGGGTDYGGLRVSPAGTFTFGGAVFDAAKVHHAPRDQGDMTPTSCGWAGGGWRIAGPTDR